MTDMQLRSDSRELLALGSTVRTIRTTSILPPSTIDLTPLLFLAHIIEKQYGGGVPHSLIAKINKVSQALTNVNTLSVLYIISNSGLVWKGKASRIIGGRIQTVHDTIKGLYGCGILATLDLESEEVQNVLAAGKTQGFNPKNIDAVYVISDDYFDFVEILLLESHDEIPAHIKHAMEEEKKQRQREFLKKIEQKKIPLCYVCKQHTHTMSTQSNVCKNCFQNPSWYNVWKEATKRYTLQNDVK